MQREKQYDTEHREERHRQQPSPPQDEYRKRPDIPESDREKKGGKFPGEE